MTPDDCDLPHVRGEACPRCHAHDGEPFLSPAAVPAREAAAAARFVSRSLPHRAVALCRLGRNCNRTLRRFARGEEIAR